LYLSISFCSAVIHTIPPSTTPTTPTTPGLNSAVHLEALVDRIESIDVSSTQIIIQTSKVGAAENAKVSIDVIDLNTGEKLPSLNLAGILLVITRGLFFFKGEDCQYIFFQVDTQSTS
jgi:hypothetical protein